MRCTSQKRRVSFFSLSYSALSFFLHSPFLAFTRSTALPFSFTSFRLPSICLVCVAIVLAFFIWSGQRDTTAKDTSHLASQKPKMINLDDITEDGGVVPDRSLSDAHSSMGGLAEMSSVPHHQTSNFAAILPDFSNMEQDYIRQAFSKTSFVSVRDLPTSSSLPPGSALAADANRRCSMLRRQSTIGSGRQYVLDV